MDNQKDMLLIENLVKIAALHKLLIKKGILSEQEVVEEMTSISKELMEQLQKVVGDNVSTEVKLA